MKDISKKIRNGGVQKFSSKDLGVNTQGKGSVPRWNHMCDDDYKKKFNKIFKKNNEPSKAD